MLAYTGSQDSDSYFLIANTQNSVFDYYENH